MEKNEKLDLKGLPQKSNDLFSLFRTYNLTHIFSDIIKALKSSPPTLTIITNHNKYKCHLEIAAAICGKISNFLKSNSELTEFSLTNEFDDSHFDQIIDFFNGIPIKITNSNRDYLKYIIQTLEINQSLIHLDSQEEITLRQFTREFYNILPSVHNNITITNAKGKAYSVNYLLSFVYCQILKKDEQLDPKKINIQLDISEDLSDISAFLKGSDLKITPDNFDLIKECFSKLQVTSFDSIFKQIESSYNLLVPTLAIINLQDTIFDINESKIDQIYELLIFSDYFKIPELHNDLLLALEIGFTYRPRYYQSIINLLFLLHGNSETLHKSLISYLISRYKLQLLSIPFLRSIYDKHIITLEEVLSIIKEEFYTFDQIYSNYVTKSKAILFFAKELYDDDKKSFIDQVNDNQRYSINVKEIEEYYDKWDEYSELVHLYHRPNDLCAAIFNDDVDLLQDISSHQPNFDYNQVLKPFLFEPFEDIEGEVTLANLAAFYGSVRCFRFLKLQQADLTNSGKFAIFGGSSEIVRLIEQDGIGLNDLFYCAIKYHRYDLFQWLLRNHGPLGELYEEEYRHGKKPLIPLSIQSYNYRAFIYFFEKGIKNTFKKYENSLLSDALFASNIHALKLLCFTYQVDVNRISVSNDIPPLFYAASANLLDVVKILVEIGKCKIQKENYHNPLFVAAQKGETEIVKFLLPFYDDVIDDEYFNQLLKLDIKPEIKEILLSVKK